ncbi:MAG: ATP-binding cassette domain-containing protein [Candidatus Micrarchaeota archaeon]
MTLEARNIRKSFDKPVLKGVSIKMRKSELVALVGPSGGGKTTLLRCIAGLEAFEGEVTTQDRPAMVFQDYNLWPHKTVLENVAEAPRFARGLRRSDAEALAKSVLNLVNLADKSDSFPHELSGGQSQRAAIARALAVTPETILLDEVTSNLDPHARGGLVRLLRKLKRRGNTLMLATHDMATAKALADRIILLENGSVTCDCSANEFFSGGNARAKRFLDGSNALTH